MRLSLKDLAENFSGRNAGAWRQWPAAGRVHFAGSPGCSRDAAGGATAWANRATAGGIASANAQRAQRRRRDRRGQAGNAAPRQPAAAQRRCAAAVTNGLNERMNTPPHQWNQTALPPPPVPSAVSGQVVARSDMVLPPNPAGTAPLGNHHKMPAKQIVNDREILLEYELSKVGPSGIGTVELWLSKDGGQTWCDEPFEDPDPKASTSGGKYQRTLLLPGDGVFGLYMVVRNSVGLGKPKPKPGYVPEMIIEVDTTQPKAESRSQPVIGQQDTVLLKWTAEQRIWLPTRSPWSGRRSRTGNGTPSAVRTCRTPALINGSCRCRYRAGIFAAAGQRHQVTPEARWLASTGRPRSPWERAARRTAPPPSKRRPVPER